MRWAALVGIVLAALPAYAQKGTRVLRVGVIAPEGSSWMREGHALANELSRQSGGRLAIRLLPNAAAGEEREMVARVRDGQLDGCGISVSGARAIAPELSVFLLPRLVRNYAEYDELWDQMRPIINERLAQRGFVMLARAEAGYEYIWSKHQPIRSLADLRKQKLWQWDDDAVTSEFAGWLHLPVQRMGLYEALPALRGGRVEGLFPFPPLAVLAFQLHPEIKWALDWKICFLSGGIFISKKVMDSLSDEDQRLLRTTSQKFESRLIRIMRDDNDRSVELLKKQGVKFVQPDPKAAEELEQAFARARKDLGPRLIGAIAYPELEAAIEARRRK
jgi:TRAP-type C4-dicarboxylate transport system substrate-binding protein